MSPDDQPTPAVSPQVVAEAMEKIRHSKPEDYDGHTEFARLTPDARLTWLEAAVRFVQSSKTVRPLGTAADNNQEA